jgi:3-methyladenine DNA glycosylase AlkD
MGRNEQRAEDIAAQMVRDIRHLPVRNTASIRKLRKALSLALRNAQPHEVLAISSELIDRDLRWVGYELITHHAAARSSLRRKDIELLGAGLDGWGVVDAFGVYIAGPAWRDRQITDADVIRWAKSEDVWWRRVALVATTSLNARGAKGDATRTLKIARLFVDEREDMVVKALSWALRTLAVIEPAAVRAFLSEHSERLARRVVRETTNKLTTGLKSGAVSKG